MNWLLRFLRRHVSYRRAASRKHQEPPLFADASWEIEQRRKRLAEEVERRR